MLDSLWTVAHQAPLSMGFPRQEYWSGLPFPSPRDLPHPGIEIESPALADSFLTTESSGTPQWRHYQMPKVQGALPEPKLRTCHERNWNQSTGPKLSHQLTWPHCRGKNRSFLPFFFFLSLLKDILYCGLGFFSDITK